MAYCTVEEVNSLFGDVSDDIPTEMFTTVIENATSWIDSALKKNNVPIPVVTVEQTIEQTEQVEETSVNTVTDVDETSEETDETETNQNTDSNGGVNASTTTVTYNLVNVPSGLRTASIYHSASDIILSLYQGSDEMPVQYDVWFNKAQQLLQDYIEAYWNEEADDSDKAKHQTVAHTHSKTYNEKRKYRRRFLL